MILRPAEEAGIERKDRIDGTAIELVPTNCALRARRDLRHVVALATEDDKGGACRVRHDGEAQNVRNVLRLTQDRATRTLHALRIGIHVIHGDIADPAGLRAIALFLRDCDHAADADVLHREACIGIRIRADGLGLPADDMGIKSAGGLRIRRHEFIPAEPVGCAHLSFLNEGLYYSAAEPQHSPEGFSSYSSWRRIQFMAPSSLRPNGARSRIM